MLHSAWNMCVFSRASKDIQLQFDSEIYLSTPVLKSLETQVFSIFLSVGAISNKLKLEEMFSSSQVARSMSLYLDCVQGLCPCEILFLPV